MTYCNMDSLNTLRVDSFAARYGVLGDGVNLAADLEEANKHYGSQMLITETTHAAPGVQEHFITRLVDWLPPKEDTLAVSRGGGGGGGGGGGASTPMSETAAAPSVTRVYEVLGRRSTTTPLCRFEGSWHPVSSPLRGRNDVKPAVPARALAVALEEEMVEGSLLTLPDGEELTVGEGRLDAMMVPATLSQVRACPRGVRSELPSSLRPRLLLLACCGFDSSAVVLPLTTFAIFTDLP